MPLPRSGLIRARCWTPLRPNPSSVQRADGKIVTVYYAKRVENHDRYHMGAAIWEAPAK